MFRRIIILAGTCSGCSSDDGVDSNGSRGVIVRAVLGRNSSWPLPGVRMTTRGEAATPD